MSSRILWIHTHFCQFCHTTMKLHLLDLSHLDSRNFLWPKTHTHSEFISKPHCLLLLSLKLVSPSLSSSQKASFIPRKTVKLAGDKATRLATIYVITWLKLLWRHMSHPRKTILFAAFGEAPHPHTRPRIRGYRDQIEWTPGLQTALLHAWVENITHERLIFRELRSVSQKKVSRKTVRKNFELLRGDTLSPFL